MQLFKKEISLKQAAEISGYDQDYLGFLIRNGEMKGIKKGGIWFTTEGEVKRYIIAQKNLHKIPTKELAIKKFFSHIPARNILVFTFLLFIGFSSFAFRDSLQSTSTNLADGWSTFTNELLDNSENGIHNDKELIITLGNISSSTSDALALGWSTFTNELIDNSENAFYFHKQFADSLENNLTDGVLVYTNGISNWNNHIASTLTNILASTLASTKNLGLATTASVGDALQSTSTNLADGWSTFTNEILNNITDSVTGTKEFAVSVATIFTPKISPTNFLTSISDDLAYGWSTFTNELIDNSINSFSSHKQFADNLSNNLTNGVLAYTNGILNLNDHIASTLTSTLASTKDLGLATTASVGDALLETSNGISDGWGVFINGIIDSAENGAADTKKLATSLWSGIISAPKGIISDWNSFLAILSHPTIITVPIILPPSLVTTAPVQTPPAQTPSVPLSGEASKAPASSAAGRSITNNITQQQRDVYINQYDPSILPRLQGIELALANSISHNTNQTDRVYDSIINSINSASNNITEEGILNDSTLNDPTLNRAIIKNSIITDSTFAGSTGTYTGNISALTFNNLTITDNGTNTLNIATGKTLAVTQTLTLSGTDGTTMTFPTTSATIARTDASNTFTGHQTIEGVTSTGATGTGNFVFDNTPTFITPVLGVANGTSLALGGATIGTDALAVTGSVSLNGATTANTFSSSGATITGGTINNSTIGITTPVAGNFSTIGATTQGTGAFTTITNSGNATLATDINTINTFGSGASSNNTIGSTTTPGALTLHGATTLDNTFSQTGANTFGTGTGAVSLNGATSVTGTNTFNVGTGTATFGGDILASTGSIDIGSTGTHFGTVYADNVTASNIYGTMATGSTSSNDWTINSDNVTVDTENMSLAFERGTLTNATLVWDATGKKFILNAPLELASTIGTATFLSPGLITATSGLTATTGNITATAGNVAITAGLLSLNGVTRIDNTGVGTFITGTVIGSQTFTTNNILDSGALTIATGAGTALTLNSGTTGTINIGTDASAETINIGNTGAAVKTILIGNNSQANTITIGDATTSALSLTDDNWSVTGAGAANFASVNGNIFTTGSSTYTGTAGQTYTFPTTTATIARTDAANTFTGHQTIEGVTSTGATGTGRFVFDTAPTITTSLTMADAANIILNTTTGTKFGTAINQKLSFYNSTPIVQPTGDIATALSNLGLVATPTIAANTIASHTFWGQTYTGAADVSGSLTAVGNITGGASSMTITAGTGNSRTLALQSTTSGGTATTFLTGNADQSATFANTVNATVVNATTGVQINGVATAGTILRGNGTNYVATTATFADTYTASNLLYSNGASTVTGLATANSGVLVTNATGVPSILGSMTNGQLVVGSTGATPVLATITGTTNQIVVTNGAGTITLSSPQSINTTSTPQFARLGLGVAADTTNILTATSISTTDLSKTLNITHTGAITTGAGTGYAGYFSKTGASTTNVGLYTTATGATNNYSLQVDSGAAAAGTYTIYANGLAKNYFAGNIGIGDAAPGTNLSVVGTAQIGYASGTTVSAGTSLAVSGNVGIGTTAPAAKLHIMNTGAGVSKIAALLTNGDGTAGTETQLAFTTLNTDPASNRYGYIGYVINGVNGGDMRFATQRAGYGPAEAMRILDNGNVGIGTTAPTSKLMVGGGGSIQIQNYGIAQGGLTNTVLGYFAGSASIQGETATYGGMKIISDATTWSKGRLGFFTNDIDGTDPLNPATEKMTILSGGNVGIGTMVPGAKLEVYDSTAINDNTGRDIAFVKGFLNQNYNAREGLTFKANWDGVNLFRAARISAGINDTNIGGKLYFETRPADGLWSSDAEPTVKMTIDATGNVGIGTTNPFYKLDLTVAAVANSTYNFGSNSSVNSNISSTGTYYTNAISTDISNYILGSGVTNSGYAIAANTNAYIDSPNFKGTLAVNTGIQAKAGFYTAGAGAKIDNAYAGYFMMLNNSTNGTITNAYGVYIDNSQTTGTITNRYGLYQNGSSAINYFAGNVGIGTTGPTQKLEVVGPSQTPDDGNSLGGILSISTGTGAQTNNKLNIGIHDGDYSWLQAVQGSTGFRNLSLNPNGGNVGIGTTNPTAKLEVKGAGTGAIIAKFTDVNTTGCTIADGGTIACSSDVRLKKNILNINYGLGTVMALRPVVYNWNYEADGSIKNLGFIAQEVEAIIPKLVSTDAEGMKSLNTTGIVPILTKAIQEMNLKVEDLSSLDTTKAISLGSLIKRFLADMGNNVTDLYASVIHSDKVQTKMLCVGTTCVTEDQFLEIVNKSGVVTGGQGGDQSNDLTPEQIEAARVAKIATDLATIKTSAGALTEANYTAGSWTTFQTALADALALPEDTEANQTAKTAAITSAIGGLVPIAQAPTAPNLTAYNAAINAKAEADYTTDSWTTYQAVITANVVTTANSQSEVDNATSKITAAQGSLTLK